MLVAQSALLIAGGRIEAGVGESTDSPGQKAPPATGGSREVPGADAGFCAQAVRISQILSWLFAGVLSFMGCTYAASENARSVSVIRTGCWVGRAWGS